MHNMMNPRQNLSRNCRDEGFNLIDFLFLANVPILYPLRTIENQKFSAILSEYKR